MPQMILHGYSWRFSAIFFFHLHLKKLVFTWEICLFFFLLIIFLLFFLFYFFVFFVFLCVFCFVLFCFFCLWCDFTSSWLPVRIAHLKFSMLFKSMNIAFFSKVNHSRYNLLFNIDNQWSLPGTILGEY